VCKLFEQYRRKIKVATEGDAVTLQITQHPKQREVSLGGSFV
jgi:hypothetical protein